MYLTAYLIASLILFAASLILLLPLKDMASHVIRQRIVCIFVFSAVLYYFFLNTMKLFGSAIILCALIFAVLVTSTFVLFMVNREIKIDKKNNVNNNIIYGSVSANKFLQFYFKIDAYLLIAATSLTVINFLYIYYRNFS